MNRARQNDLAPAAAAAAAGDGVADATDLAQVRAIVDRSGTTFRWGMRILPRAKRDAMYAIYAFCRAVDDVVDEPGSVAAKRAQLESWREEVARLYAGRPRHPIGRALRRPVVAFDLPQSEFLTIVDGMAMDAREVVPAPSRSELALYCRRVAGAVGRLSIRVFGDTRPAAEELALTLGEALQLTNILRDLAEDAGRNRLYLPRELLAAHGIEGTTAAAVLADPALAHACTEMAAHARERFRQARGLLAQCDRRAMRPAAVMLAAYECTLARLEARGWERPEQRVGPSAADKLRIVLRHGLI